ncbi:TIGR04211 family SH3 domain-containing protein [Halomonas daqiaonensis]|uniref:SH3 domain protein n=1 Tax=Halomonas daqiaonensis TaxID=650850 RepID=A0A1H7VUD2_9GAMM|nr:TIGR04211 family SH3 domain-containing protein [Halomonas daqiaonensis]SEM12489.1 SH3 domain protein [Halomonas daqiaonensis]
MTIHRLKILTLGVALVTLPLTLHAQEEVDATAWVSDDLTTFVRSGPTDGYRIIGTLTAGEPVTVLETSGDYSRVVDAEGDTVWILSDELQETPSAQERLPVMEARVEELTEELAGINDTWQSRTASMSETLEVRERRIAELESRNAALEEETEQARSTIRELQARLDTQEEDLLMRYFMYGGGVAGAGLLVGLIVPHLPRRRRKRDRWF